jgi:methyltransferase-like protein/SAM-dependent methyltransferase
MEIDSGLLIASAATTSYDEVPYPSFPLAQTHPDRLATLATLFGMSVPPVERCRVLELGCADGGNLIAMAEGLPEGRFLGIDFSGRQIATGRANLEAVGLTNVELRHASILDLGDDLGSFDYIICHGVYSWVPRPVQDKILAICRRHLDPCGVAYISYNTYPGWHAREAVRRMMRYHTQRTADPRLAIDAARDLVAFLLQVAPSERQAYRGLLEEENERLGKARDTYIFHEHLEEVNAPVYFHDFVERAARHELQFLTDLVAFSGLPQYLPPPSAATLGRLAGAPRERQPHRDSLTNLPNEEFLECHPLDVLQREQYLDFLSNRMFRQTLLCHAGVGLDREASPDRLAALRIASCAKCVTPPVDIHSSRPQEFRGPTEVGAITSHPISKAALVYLAEIWPRSVPFADLQALARSRLVGDATVVQDAKLYQRDTRLLAENLLKAFSAAVVELHAHAPRFAAAPTQCPRATAFARFQAREGDWVTNACHQMVNLDPLNRHLLRHLDGRHDREALVEELVRAAMDKTVVLERFGRPVTDADRLRDILRRELDAALHGLAKSALLVA